MFPITITIHNAEQLADVMHALSVSQCVPHEQLPVVPKVAPVPKFQAELVANAAEQAAAVASASANAEEPQPPVAAASTEYSVDNAKALTLKLVAKVGADKVRELLAKYNAPVAAKLAPEHVASFCTDAEAALAA